MFYFNFITFGLTSKKKVTTLQHLSNFRYYLTFWILTSTTFSFSV